MVSMKFGLTDLQAFSKDNNGIKYLLTVIDIYSKFAWIIPLKQKTGQEVAKVFSRIFREGRHSKMWVDKCREFYNKDDQKLVVTYFKENEEKSCVIENSVELLRKTCLIISLLIIQENLLMYLTYLQINTIIQFIHQ